MVGLPKAERNDLGQDCRYVLKPQNGVCSAVSICAPDNALPERDENRVEPVGNNPFALKHVTHVVGINCYLCDR